MRKIYLTLIFLITITSQLFSQDCDTIGLEPQFVKKLINQQFGNLINPQSKNIIGNFASFDPKDAEATFAGNIIFNNGSILGIKANGQITDGFLPIFSNTELNSKIGLDIQYNFLALKKAVQFDNALCEIYKANITKIEHEHDLKHIEIQNEQKKILANIDIEKLKYSFKTDTAKLRIDKEKLGKDINTLKEVKEKLGSLTGLEIDSLKKEIEKAEHELIIAENEIKKTEIEIAKNDNELNFKIKQILPDSSDQYHELHTWRATEITKLQSDFKINGFNINWLSFGCGISNNSFRLFDPTSVYENQISRETFLSYNFRVQYSIYNRSVIPYESYFFSFGTAFSNEDNLSSLSKVEINETKNYGPNQNDRYINNKFNAYKGSYRNNLKTISFYSDFYYFLFNDNGGAVHIYPEFSKTENLEARTDLGFGFLLTFKNTEEKKNVVNSELYINLINVFNKNNPEVNLWNRSSYGIRFTFPIDFNSKL